jgi:phage tail tape-measure protein
MTAQKNVDGTDLNLDPLSGATGAHPVGTGLGAAAGGAAAGAAIGTVAGPLGTAIGAAAGAIVGGLAGKGVAEAIDPTAEDVYWRETYATRPYVTANTPYSTYEPAYRYGWEARDRYPGQSWDQTEAELAQRWADTPYAGTLGWDSASPAVRDAWDRATGRKIVS